MESNVPYLASNATMIDYDNEGWRVVTYTKTRRARNPRPTPDLGLTQSQINQEFSLIDELLSSGRIYEPPAQKPQPSHPAFFLLRQILEQVLPTFIRITAGESLQYSKFGRGTIQMARRDQRQDIIFVHGLNGTSRSTWSKDKNMDCCWSDKWLPQEPEICTARVLSFGYNAAASPTRSATILDITDFGVNLLFCMKYGKDERKNERNTVTSFGQFSLGDSSHEGNQQMLFSRCF